MNLSGRHSLRAFVRFDKQHKVVADSLLLRRTIPTSGHWMEIGAYTNYELPSGIPLPPLAGGFYFNVNLLDCTNNCAILQNNILVTSDIALNIGSFYKDLDPTYCWQILSLALPGGTPVTDLTNVISLQEYFDCLSACGITTTSTSTTAAITTTTSSSSTTTTTTTQALGCIDYGLLYNFYAATNQILSNTSQYGYLYNGYAYTDARLAPAGWHVPTAADFTTLINFLGDVNFGFSNNGGHLKEVGETHWLTPNTGATDVYGFALRGAGQAFGGFYDLEEVSYLACTDSTDTMVRQLQNYSYNSNAVCSYGILASGGYKIGYSVRLVKDDSTNTGTLTDRDGNVYTTVTIGTQVWTASNLIVQHFNDGVAIPKITNTPTWNGLTSAGLCAYNYLDVTVDNPPVTADAHIPTITEWTTLITYLITIDPGNEGGLLKEIGTTHWIAPNTGALDSYGFKALPGSGRFSIDGTWIGDMGQYGYLWTSTYVPINSSFNPEFSYISGTAFILSFAAKAGASIRPIVDTPTTTDIGGLSGTYRGVDGTIYKWVSINGQKWLAENLAETKYRDGSAIPEITDDTAWSLLSTGALCAYNNDWANVGCGKASSITTTTTSTTLVPPTTTTTTTAPLGVLSTLFIHIPSL